MILQMDERGVMMPPDCAGCGKKKGMIIFGQEAYCVDCSVLKSKGMKMVHG